MHISYIGRFENGSCNPSPDFLAKVARGLGKELPVELRQVNKDGGTAAG